ncbi:MAG: 2-amino-4-hydroxy-6-hydroxymethyldihydropteridine diphosphokinase [Nitrospirota bacterium]|nr:2-amino-4-hydroxy-6-hydroxymethyldihydropteridine diphosphokinase [Nitrospirota bacterium]
MSIVYIGIGSNLGDRQKNCLRAIELLQKRGLVVTKQSSLYETEPWGYKGQPQFINMAIELETELNPKELLTVLKNIEREMGREELLRWGPRNVDLDILLFDDIILTEDNLKIPHPLMHKRDFVLKPLCEIASDIHHPLLKVSISGLLQRFYKKSLTT